MEPNLNIICPACGNKALSYRNPFLTVDVIICMPNDGIVLIERKNPPAGWALPGGFVNYGESVEDAAEREAYEETLLKVSLICQMKTYSAPNRDPRFHAVSVVFIAKSEGIPTGSDDAKRAEIFSRDSIFRQDLAFDHKAILKDYFYLLDSGAF